MADRCCTDCGQELRPGDRFCASCGTPVLQTAEASATPSSPQTIQPPQEASQERESPQTGPPEWLEVVIGGTIAAVVFGALGLWLAPQIGNSALSIAFLVWLAVVARMVYNSSTKPSKPLATAPTRNIPQWVKIAVATRDGGKCRRCGSAYDLQYDHIVPYSRGGRSDDVSNIQLLCGRCNRLKSNRYVG
jgi:hypothetical protein